MTELRYRDRREEGDTDVRKFQLVTLHLLEVLKKVCNDNKMPFWLAYGNVLGAVRHGGFISWDDDVDVYMFYDDVRRLAKIADRVFPKDVIWQDPWRFPRLASTFFARIRDAYSTMLEDCGDCPRYTTDPLGAPLDIFMLRPVRGRWGLTLLQRLRGPLEWRKRLARHRGPVTVFSLLKVWGLSALYGLVNCLYHVRILSPLGKKFYIQENVSAVGSKYVFDADWFDRKKEIQFEGELFPVPSGTDAYCKMVWGADYMTPRNTKGSQDDIIYLPATACVNGRAMRF